MPYVSHHNWPDGDTAALHSLPHSRGAREAGAARLRRRRCFLECLFVLHIPPLDDKGPEEFGETRLMPRDEHDAAAHFRASSMGASAFHRH